MISPMHFPFEGELSFHHIDEELPLATEVLRQCCWKIDEHNAPYLSGKAAESSHELVELTDDQSFGGAPLADLPQEWSEADTLAVVGDINHTLRAGRGFIVARACDFGQAGELAGKMDYRPALAGEFLQLLWWLEKHKQEYRGWFYCYVGRKPRYAVLAEYGYQCLRRIIFDTYIGDQAEEGYMGASMDTYCFFVTVAERS